MRFGKTDAARVAAIGLVASIGGAVALWPRLNHHPLLSPWAPIVNRMAGHGPDQAEPPFHTRVDVAAFERAGSTIPAGAAYYVALPANATSVRFTDVL